MAMTLQTISQFPIKMSGKKLSENMSFGIQQLVAQGPLSFLFNIQRESVEYSNLDLLLFYVYI